MNKALQSTFDEIQKLPNKQQEHFALVLEGLLDQANLAAKFDLKMSEDNAYSAYVKKSLSEGELDVEQGRTKDIDQLFDELDLQIKSKNDEL